MDVEKVTKSKSNIDTVKDMRKDGNKIAEMNQVCTYDRHKAEERKKDNGRGLEFTDEM